MDVFLPDGDGLSVVRRLMDREKHPDVIVITAARDVATVRTAMQLGAIHYLVKPFGFAALGEQLHAYRRLRQRIAGLPARSRPVRRRRAVRHPARPTAPPGAAREGTLRADPASWSATPSAPRSRSRRPKSPSASASAAQPPNAI